MKTLIIICLIVLIAIAIWGLCHIFGILSKISNEIQNLDNRILKITDSITCLSNCNTNRFNTVESKLNTVIRSTDDKFTTVCNKLIDNNNSLQIADDNNAKRYASLFEQHETSYNTLKDLYNAKSKTTKKTTSKSTTSTSK